MIHKLKRMRLRGEKGLRTAELGAGVAEQTKAVETIADVDEKIADWVRVRNRFVKRDEDEW